MKKTFILISILFLGLFSAQAQLPMLELSDINGKKLSTEQILKMKKPVIISFFATWCKPCIRELTTIHEVYDEWKEEFGVELIAVSIDEGANVPKVKPLVLSKEWEYTVLLDKNKEFMRAMNITAVPSIFILNPEGKIVYRHTGFSEGSENEIVKELRKIKK